MSGNDGDPTGAAAHAPPPVPAVAPPVPSAAPPAGPGAVRVTDAERQAVVDQLGRATADGLITLDELSRAAEEAFAAVTRDDLEAVGRDLALPITPAEAARATAVRVAPGPGADEAGATAAGRRKWVVAIMSGVRRKGRWRVGRRVGAFAFWGSATLDLRDAVVEDDQVEITAWVLMGGVTVIVPEGIPVELEGLVVMGGRTDRVRDVPVVPGAPRITVRAYGMWGGVEVRSRPPRGSADDSDEDDRGGEHRVHGGHRAVAGASPDVSHGGRRPTPAPAVPTRPSAPPRPEVSGDLVTIICTDIVGSTRHALVLGDQRWREVLSFHNTLVRSELERFGGTEVKTTGDGFIATFTSARAALRCSVGIQDALHDLRRGATDAPPLEVRVGVHAGEVERDGDDVVGRNVTIACRLCDVAAPNEVLASAVVADLADSASDLTFDEPREHQLAGIDRPLVARRAGRR